MIPAWAFKLVTAADGVRRCVFDVRVLAPDDPAVLARWDACDACERGGAGAWRCGECGCVLKCLLRIPEAACPHAQPRWGPVALDQAPAPEGSSA